MKKIDRLSSSVWNPQSKSFIAIDRLLTTPTQKPTIKTISLLTS